MSIWDTRGNMDDIVISSRVRVARNLSGIPFPACMNDAQGIDIGHRVEECFRQRQDSGRFSFKELRSIGETEGRELVERHLLSPLILKKADCAAFILRDDEEVCVMINEEDHLRIQSMKSGMALQEAFKQAFDITDFIEQHFDMAYSDTLGYLSACPTNVGTGIRASAMLHLPMLNMTGQLKEIIESTAKSGITVRGIYGEGSEALGELYQISNTTTLALTENEIAEGVQGVCVQIDERERQTRAVLMQGRGIELEDMVMRSAGILSLARRMSINEFMKHISNVRLGISMGYIKGIDQTELNSLMIRAQSAAIERMGAGAEDEVRARIAREALKGRL